MPSRQEITDTVIQCVSGIAHMPAALAMTLQEPPLRLDASCLAQLALGLRSYVQTHRPGATIRVTELRADGLTVAAVVDLVAQRILG